MLATMYEYIVIYLVSTLLIYYASPLIAPYRLLRTGSVDRLLLACLVKEVTIHRSLARTTVIIIIFS